LHGLLSHKKGDDGIEEVVDEDILKEMAAFSNRNTS
jgi:hypothetical protein